MPPAPQQPPQQPQGFSVEAEIAKMTPEQLAQAKKLYALAAAILVMPVAVERCPQDDDEAFSAAYFNDPPGKVKRVLVQTTVAQLLAEIADSQRAVALLLDMSEEEEEEEPEPPRRRRG
jgi:hypothetical protein